MDWRWPSPSEWLTDLLQNCNRINWRMLRIIYSQGLTVSDQIAPVNSRSAVVGLWQNTEDKKEQSSQRHALNTLPFPFLSSFILLLPLGSFPYIYTHGIIIIMLLLLLLLQITAGCTFNYLRFFEWFLTETVYVCKLERRTDMLIGCRNNNNNNTEQNNAVKCLIIYDINMLHSIHTYIDRYRYIYIYMCECVIALLSKIVVYNSGWQTKYLETWVEITN